MEIKVQEQQVLVGYQTKYKSTEAVLSAQLLPQTAISCLDGIFLLLVSRGRIGSQSCAALRWLAGWLAKGKGKGCPTMLCTRVPVLERVTAR